MSSRRIGVITGSSRSNRRSMALAQAAVAEMSAAAPELEFEIVDLAEVNLPFFDEEMPPRSGVYANPHTIAWSEKIDKFDGFVMLVPEYNGSYPAVFKNAIDFLAAEWRNKPVALITYGASGAASVASFTRTLLERIGMQVVEPVISIPVPMGAAPEVNLLVDSSLDLQKQAEGLK